MTLPIAWIITVPTLLLCFAQQGFARPGDLVSTFGVGGKVVPPSSASSTGADALLLADGRILAGGRDNRPGTGDDFLLLRLLANGSLDTTFGNGGRVHLDFGNSSDSISCMALDQTGRIIAAGYGAQGQGVAVARFLPEGALDTSFGNQGKVAIRLGSANNSPADLKIQSDGRILLTTFAFSAGWDFGLLRLLPDGQPDEAFGNNGVVITGFFDPVEDRREAEEPGGLALLSDGGFFLGGTSNTFGLADFALVKYGPNGSMVNAFGTGGFSLIPIGTDRDLCHAMTELPDGKLLMAGGSRLGTGYAFSLARRLADGSPDPSFGGSGSAVMDFGPDSEQIYGIAAQPDGTVLAGGYAQQNGNFSALLARLQLDGTPDPGFGTGGFQIIDKTAGYDIILDVIMSSDGTAIVTGTADGRMSLSRVETLAAIERWRWNEFPAGAGHETTGDLADFDGDGLTNLIEYAFGTDPVSDRAHQLPQGQWGGSGWSISFSEPSGIEEIAYGAEWSPNLEPGTWQPIPDAGAGQNHSFGIPVVGERRSFVRLTARRTP